MLLSHRRLWMLALLAAAATCWPVPRLDAAQKKSRPPNVVFILADDLGYGDLGCYGQEKIKTPNLDRMAAEGMRFTQFYAGSTVCAPSRCCLLTGRHTGHAYIRDNKEVQPEGQWPIPADAVTVATALKQSGYATACVGKWGLGGPGSTGEPTAHGFDHFYGHLCQRVAHNHYSPHLWRDGKKVVLEGNTPGNAAGRQYAPDLMADDALQFIRDHAAQASGPFFLYFATPLPHVSLQAPDDTIAPYRGLWPETPFKGQGDYTPQPTPRAAYAAMVTRIDTYVGRMLALVKELGLDDNTLVLFTSDNGPTFNGGTDSAFFRSAGGLRGLKQDLYEGGIRAPLIARWPGKVRAGSTSDLPAAQWDLFPTLTASAGAKAVEGLDGLSLLPTLVGRGEQSRHEYLYWEYHSQGGSQAVRLGDWKAVRKKLNGHRDAPIELYDLAADSGEQKDVAGEHPDVVAQVRKVLSEARTESDVPGWRF